jgi:hypothetical protein
MWKLPPTSRRSSFDLLAGDACIMCAGREAKVEILVWPITSSCSAGSERHLASAGAVDTGKLPRQGELPGHEQKWILL